MRVLHLDGGREMRGGQRQVLRLVEGLLARGIECRLLSRNGSPLLEEARRRGWDAAPLSLARVAIDSRRADIVHAHDGRSHTAAAIAARAPLVVARRVAFPIGSKWKYRRAAKYIAVSRFVAGVLERGGVAGQKISVVYDAVPHLEPAAARSGVLAPANADDPMKGADLAAEAARIAGVPISFSGDLERDLPAASVFVYLTRSEGLGSAVLLAMAAGAAVVASRVGGLPEAVDHERTGLLVENDSQAVAAAILRLTSDAGLAAEMGVQGRMAARERFSAGRMVDDTLEVYCQVNS